MGAETTKQLTQMSDLIKDIELYYLDYVDAFMTVEGFALHHEISEDAALSLLLLGKHIHEEKCKKEEKRIIFMPVGDRDWET